MGRGESRAEIGRVLRSDRVEQNPHRREAALELADRVAVERRIRENAQLAVDSGLAAVRARTSWVREARQRLTERRTR